MLYDKVNFMFVDLFSSVFNAVILVSHESYEAAISLVLFHLVRFWSCIDVNFLTPVPSAGRVNGRVE